MVKILDAEYVKTRESELKQDLERINRYIIKNLNQDPNFYEICDCWIKFGELVCNVWQYNQENDIVVRTDKGEVCTNYNIASYDENLKPCLEELSLMEGLRNIDQSPFLEENRNCYDLYRNIVYDSFSGFINGYTDSEKELLKKCISVPFFIYQEQKKNPNFKYDNEREFLEMQCMLHDSKIDYQDSRIQIINSIIGDIEKKSLWYSDCEKEKNQEDNPVVLQKK